MPWLACAMVVCCLVLAAAGKVRAILKISREHPVATDTTINSSTSQPQNMVKLQEVEDEDFTREQTGPTEGEDDWEDESGELTPN